MRPFCALAVLFAVPVLAQVDSGWVNLYRNGTATWNYGYDIVADEAGNSYVVGSSEPGGRSLIKYDRNGAQQWVRSDAGHACQELAIVDGCPVLGGSGAGSVRVVKYRPDGSVRWTGTWDNPSGGPVVIADVLVDGEGSVYVGGYRDTHPSPDTIRHDILLTKFDSSGTHQWTETYAGTAGKDDWGAAICLDPEGNILLAGQVWNSSTALDGCIIKYSPSGNREWVQEYRSGGEVNDDFRDVATDDSGNVYVTGDCWVAPGNHDVLTARYSPTGTREWVETIAGAGGGVDEGTCVGVDRDGCVWVAGHVANRDCLVARYRADGTELWNRVYDAAGGGYDKLAALSLDPSCDAVCAGWSQGGIADREFLVVSYDSSGNRRWAERVAPSPRGDNVTWSMYRTNDGSMYLGGTAYTGGNWHIASARLPRRKEWGIYIFLNGDNNLEEAAIDDFNEIEEVANPRLHHTVIQFDRHPDYDSTNGNWTSTRRYLVVNDPGNLYGIESALQEDMGEQNMGSGQTLADFAAWAAENFPARKTCLVCWNHGDGWADEPPGFSFSDDETDADRIGVASERNELRRALEEINRRMGRNIDVFCFDACLMGMVEVEEECRDYCDYVVHSEEKVPSKGFDYYGILQYLNGRPAATPAELAVAIAETTAYSYAPGGRQFSGRSVTFSTADLGPVFNRAANLFDDFVAELIRAGGRNRTEMVFVRDNCQRFSVDPGSPSYNLNVDLVNFADAIVAQATLPVSLRDAAQRLADTLFNDLLVAHLCYSHPGDYPVDGARGVSVYYPLGALPDSTPYDSLRFAATSLWDEYLRGAVELPDQAILVYFGNTVGEFVGVDTVRLRITLRNLGRATASGVTVRLHDNDPFVEVIQDASGFPDCPGESTATSLSEFVLVINPLTPQPHRVPLFVTVTNGRDDPPELSFSVVVDTVAAGIVAGGRAGTGAGLQLRARPNPALRRPLLEWVLPMAGPVRLGVYDATGRLVRMLVDARVPSGGSSVRWDGRDESGREVAAGVYFARLAASGVERTARVVLLR